MTLRNHDLMLEICTLLDDNAGIRMKGRITVADRAQLEKNEAELKRLGKQLELKSFRVVPKAKHMKKSEMTPAEQIEEAISFGLTNTEICRTLHVGHTRVFNTRVGYDLYQSRSKLTKYEIYRGENLVARGTAARCAEKLKVTPGYICWLTTDAARKHIEKKKCPEECLIGFFREVNEAVAE